MPTIAQAIEKEENVITEYEGLINEINHRLRVKNLTKEARDELESELRQLRKKKNMTEQVVGKLRKENRKTMVFSLLLMALGVIVYFGAQSFYAT